MTPASASVLLRIRPSLPDTEETSAKRGPLMMESVLSSLHSLRGKDGVMSLEIGYAEGKISLFARVTPRAASLVESQMYAQYPDADIEVLGSDPFLTREGEAVASADLTLAGPEVIPIKRHPQFDDVMSRQNVDTIAGITSALVRYPKSGMRGHVQIAFRPIHGNAYRKRALKFIPLLSSGLPKHWAWYGNLLAKAHLARGWRWWAYLPLNLFMGGFRAWMPGAKSQVSLMTGEVSESRDPELPSGAAARNHDREDTAAAAVDKVNRLLFYANVRISVITPAADAPDAQAKVEEIASSFRQFSLPHCNGFAMRSVRTHPSVPHGFASVPFALSVEELATLWHIPNILVKTPNLDWVTHRKLEPPVNLPLSDEEDVTALGEAVFRGNRQQFGIRPDDRRRHMYIIGKTGMGKSTLLENMLFSDIHAGRGVALIDPHGDLVDAVTRFIPKHRTNDVILFDPADKDHPIAFNMLDCENPDQYPLVASGMMSVFKKLWPDAWSGRMEHIMRNTLLALLEAGGNSMLGILRMYSDDAFREKVVSRTNDHLVKSFWEGEYKGWSEKYRTEAVAAIQNKIGQLLSVPMLRNIIGQAATKLDLRHAMDTGKIILVNLSKGNIGEDESAFLGSMLVTKFQLDAMSRANIPEKERRDFYLYVDEFQNFATESFATILSEARKYRLNLTMANQYIGQLLIGQNKNDQTLINAVFGNVGSLVSFQVGSDDAEVLSQQFEELVLPKDILSLPKYHAYMRLMIDGMASKSFSVSTLPPPDYEQDKGRWDTIRRMSRERYAEPRRDVEERLGKWIASAEEGRVTAKAAEKAKEKEEEEKKKARKKGMSLAEYRAWRDREMWTNDFNMLRKKEFMGEALSDIERSSMQELEKKLMESGGVPLPSKAMLELREKRGL